jgi:3-hydroxyisobutyrate dehydrogenase-like beta-hydroxyacid dehydrogenase
MSDFDVGFVGFGEAAQAFVAGWRDTRTPETDGAELRIATFDIKFDDPGEAAEKRTECETWNVVALDTPAELARSAPIVISAVAADQVIVAAASVAAELRAGTLYLDINSAAPAKKRAAAARLGDRGDGYVDGAVLAPVRPKRHQTPLLIGGPGAERCRNFLTAWQFDFEVVSTEVGYASTVKMIRSIFVKGLESVTFECALAAYQAGIPERVFPSLANVLRFVDAKDQADYMMERVAVHGTRRAAEMREVVDTLSDLGLSTWMAEASARQQQFVADLNLTEHFADNVPQDAAAIARAVLSIKADKQ